MEPVGRVASGVSLTRWARIARGCASYFGRWEGGAVEEEGRGVDGGGTDS